jgi:hypothetical protein
VFGSEFGSNQVSGSGPAPRTRRTKITHKNRKNLRNFMYLSVGCSLLRAEGFSFSLDVLWWRPREMQIVIFDQKNMNFFKAVKKSFSAYYYLKVNLHHFSKIKSPKEVTCSRNQGFSYYICLTTERSRSGSIPLNNGYGIREAQKHVVPGFIIFILKITNHAL